MMRASMPLAAIARATASSTIATTCSLERPRLVWNSGAKRISA